MKAKPAFAYRDYRSFLQALIKSHPEPWGLIAKMAKAARCQRPYLSKVLKGEAQLTPSQAYGLSRFWKLDPEQTEFFLGLLEEERAGSAEYREHIRKKNAVLKREQEDLAKRTQRESVVIETTQVDYYSAWHWTAIHILVSIPEYQTLDSISRRLSLDPNLVFPILQRLEQRGFVRNHSGRWKFEAHETHVPKTSPLVAFHHANWRQRAVTDAQNPGNEGIHYTAVHSLSRADFEQIKQQLLEFIESAARIAGPSREEELMCLTCDLFKP